ncbi:MAG TPA: hypothetical protein VGF45_02780 [Polyangia bacterium]
MKTFLAVYIGTASALEKAGWEQMDDERRRQIDAEGVKAWEAWAAKHAAAIIDMGAPLGKTKRAGKDGVTDTKNNLTGYVIVRAESHEAAAKMFEGHPHFTVFPGDSVEIMECIPLPT